MLTKCSVYKYMWMCFLPAMKKATSKSNSLINLPLWNKILPENTIIANLPNKYTHPLRNSDFFSSLDEKDENR
jgi:hypothetical protein